MKTPTAPNGLGVLFMALMAMLFASEVHAQSSNLILAPYGPYGSTTKLTEFQSFILRDMQTNGRPMDEILSRKENFKIQNDGVSIRNWNEWTNYYQTEVLKVPIVFDTREPVATDFSNPISAYHSIVRAYYVGDAQTIKKHSDASFLAWMKRTGMDKITPATGVFATNFTHKTVLFTAKTALDHKEYSLVFCRIENSHNPTNGTVIFNGMMFVRDQNTYLLTRDLEGSEFGMPFSFATRGSKLNVNMGRYGQIHELLKQSTFPPSFYTIE